MTRCVSMKVLRHKPTGKWVKLEMADALYGWVGDEIEGATLFPPDAKQDEVCDGVDFQFEKVQPENFELVDVTIDYKWES